MPNFKLIVSFFVKKLRQLIKAAATKPLIWK